RTEAAWTAAVAAAALLLALSLRLDRGWRFRLAPLLPALALCDLLAAHGAINPGLPLPRLYPPTGAVRFLARQPGRVAGTGDALRPNAAMVYGLYDLRGDDPVKLVSYEAVYRQFAAADPVYFQPITQWSSPWLDRLGLRWVVAGPGETPRAADWRLAYAGADARVYERPAALPLVRWAPPAPAASAGSGSAATGAGSPPAPMAGDAARAALAAVPPAGLTVMRREPGRWEIGWQSAEPRLLVVAESWAPGWRALVDGQPRPVAATADALLGVRLGPGAGRAELLYRPPGLLAGAWISAAALLVLVALAAARVRGAA
ncbi:MAG TPA: YfhO family protein, partial [Thermoanaerobaculia bacterium]